MIIPLIRPPVIAPTRDPLASGALPWEAGGGVAPAVNLVAPVLGEAYAGASPAITAGTWTGAPTLTYSLEVDGVEVVSGDEATVEAYVYVLGDEGLDAILYEIPDGDAGRQATSNTVECNLATKIAALYTAASWVCPGIFLVRRSAIDLSLVSTAVATWVNQGTGSDATQATSTARPTYSATAINSLPGMSADGGDWLETGLMNLTAYDRAALTWFGTKPNTTASRALASFGSASANEGAIALMGDNATDTVDAQCRSTTLASAQGATTLDAPTVVTATGDYTLVMDEAEIRINGANATASRPSNGNNTGNYGNRALGIFARSGGSLPMTGAACAVVLAAGTTAIPTSTVAAVEAILAAAWGL